MKAPRWKNKTVQRFHKSIGYLYLFTAENLTSLSNKSYNRCTTASTMNEHFDTSRYDEDDGNREITAIHICGYANEDNEGDESGRPPTNHWVAFFAFEDGGSVKVDMVPGYGSDGLTGMIILESKAYEYSDRSVKTISFGCAKTFSFGYSMSQTFSNTLDIIVERGMERYKFTKGGEGGRFWIYKLVETLYYEGHIKYSDVMCLEYWAYDILSNYWINPSDYEPRPNPMKKGTFDAEIEMFHDYARAGIGLIASLVVASVYFRYQ
jgi:hypothetical protein